MGGRCTAPALPGEQWCYGHHPNYAEKRKRDAAKSHFASPEIANIKQRLSDLASDVLDGNVDRADAAVASQILNVYLRAVSVELKVKEQQELEQRLAELELLVEQQKQGRSGYGA